MDIPNMYFKILLIRLRWTDGGLFREVNSVARRSRFNTSAGREVLLEGVVKLLRALRERRQHRDVLRPGAAHSHVLSVRALVLAPRGVAAPIESSLVPKAKEVVEPDGPRAPRVGRARCEVALRRALLPGA